MKFRGSQATDKRDIIYALLGISSDACRSNVLLPDYTKSLQQVIWDTISLLLPHTDQDESPYKFLDWTLSEFLQSLDSLSSAVIGSASEKREEATVKLLLAMDGVEANSADKYGWTPLQRASGNGHDAVVRLLLAHGAGLEAKDKDGRTPLQQAISNGHEVIVKLFLEQGAELEVKDKNGQTPLLWASKNGHEAVVKLLLERGAELEATDRKSRTPLLWASENGRETIVKLLLEQGAEIEARDRYGRTALWWAGWNGHEAMVKLLLAQGAGGTNPRFEVVEWPSHRRRARTPGAASALLLRVDLRVRRSTRQYRRGVERIRVSCRATIFFPTGRAVSVLW